MVFLVLGMLGDFQFYSGHLSIMLGDSGSYLNFLFHQEVTPIKFSTQVISTFVGCDSNANLLFRAFTMFVCLAVAAGAPTDPCWCYLMEGGVSPDNAA